MHLPYMILYMLESSSLKNSQTEPLTQQMTQQMKAAVTLCCMIATLHDHLHMLIPLPQQV